MISEILAKLEEGDIPYIKKCLASRIKRADLTYGELEYLIIQMKDNTETRDLLSENPKGQLLLNSDEWNKKYLLYLCSLIENGDISEKTLHHALDVAKYIKKRR